MRLNSWDWIVLALYAVLCIAIGLAVTRRAGQGRYEFFLSGRRLSWWLLGVSLVATTFSTDTPNLDRKSTRLNSSHTVISYAVFCLKKKKKKKKQIKKKNTKEKEKFMRELR